MKLYVKTPLSVMIGALLLTACASNGGSFDVNHVQNPNTQGAQQNTNAPSTPKEPTYQDEQGDRRTLDGAVQGQEPALGYIAEIPRRGNKTDKVGINDASIINHRLQDIPEHYKKLLSQQDKASEEIVYSHDKGVLSRNRDMQYVRSGYIIDTEAGGSWVTDSEKKRQLYVGPRGYVFYQGATPSFIMPTQKVKYVGTWDFTSDADKTRSLPDGFTSDNQNSPGNLSGATSLDAYVNNRIEGAKVGHGSEFEVDFGAKTLAGKLYSHGYVAESKTSEQTNTERYQVNATLKGNRFSGTATATDKSHTIFGQDGQLEGGFFGEKAEELAGKFLATNKSLFGVFAAKRDKLSDDNLEHKFDAIGIDTATLNKFSMDTFGQITHLIIDGKRLALLPEGIASFAGMDFIHTRQVDHHGKKLSVSVCCNNLDYIKFGVYGTANQEGGVIILKDGRLFLVGERTEAEKMPKDVKAYYRGTWEGYFDSKDGRRWTVSASADKQSGTRSLFEVDFGSKKFDGKLIGNNGLDDRPALMLNGVIAGNGFSGTAKTAEGGFNLDPKSTGAAAIVNINAGFTGGFYGPNASELGGVIHHKKEGEDGIAVVFGGKKQTKKP